MWMATVSGAVFGMVAVGGYTRLTRSGLSMVSWHIMFDNMNTLAASACHRQTLAEVLVCVCVCAVSRGDCPYRALLGY